MGIYQDLGLVSLWPIKKYGNWQPQVYVLDRSTVCSYVITLDELKNSWVSDGFKKVCVNETISMYRDFETVISHSTSLHTYKIKGQSKWDSSYVLLTSNPEGRN